MTLARRLSFGSFKIEAFQSSPAWAERVAAAHTIPRELWAEALYRFEAWRFQEFQTPTLLLLGSESPTYLKEAAYMAEAVLPESRIAVLPGEGHLAMYSGP